MLYILHFCIKNLECLGVYVTKAPMCGSETAPSFGKYATDYGTEIEWDVDLSFSLLISLQNSSVSNVFQRYVSILNILF